MSEDLVVILKEPWTITTFNGEGQCLRMLSNGDGQSIRGFIPRRVKPLPLGGEAAKCGKARY